MNRSVSSVWWLGIPLAFISLQVLGEIFLPHNILSALHSENGPHELLQFLVLLSAFILSLRLLASYANEKHPWLAIWVALAAAGCFYVGGEEISWGQQFFEWSTPESWLAINDQGETNLHNTTSWLDQKPRLLLLAGIIVGGILIPLLKKTKPEIIPGRFEPIYPPPELSLIAMLAVGVKIAEKIGEIFGLVIFERASEVEELFMYYFVLLYINSLKVRHEG